MKHKYIKTPEELYILFEGYKNSLVDEKYKKQQQEELKPKSTNHP
jgi:hypothetical protein